jgi:hypothetical protein
VIALLRSALGWAGRHIVIFLLIVLALIAAAKAYEAYRALPALEQEVAALEDRQAELDAAVARQIAAARTAAKEIDSLEASLLQQRLVRLRKQIAAFGPDPNSRPGFALDVVRGDTDAIADRLAAGFRLQLLRREEAAIEARLAMLAGSERVDSLAGFIATLDARTIALRTRIAGIERRHPIMSRAEGVPILANLRGPWRDLAAARRELASVNTKRAQLLQVRQQALSRLQAARTAYQRGREAMVNVAPPKAALQQALADRRAELSRHWATRAWEAVRPVLGAALWITFLLIVVPPAIKAFWFFVVAPAAARLRPISIRPDLAGEIAWKRSCPDAEALLPGSGVSRRIAIAPGEELLIKPAYLQSSMNQARIDSTLVLSRAIPLGSIATGLFGLTRIRVHKPEVATVSATQDLFDEVGVIDIPAGVGLVFKPRNLVGVLQRSERPMRIHRVWRLGHLSAWLTLQLRFLVFEGPGSLLVRGARGVAIEPAVDGRRIAGAATLGWSAGLAYSVRRSETFLAYLMGQQSLFNDSFAGDGVIVYEEVPLAGARGILGRGLEGFGDGLLKVVGL